LLPKTPKPQKESENNGSTYYWATDTVVALNRP